MIVVKIYAHGVGTKLRLEQHSSCCEDGGCSQPDQDATERAYASRGAPASEVVEQARLAFGRLWRAHSNRSLLAAMAHQERLPGL